MCLAKTSSLYKIANKWEGIGEKGGVLCSKERISLLLSPRGPTRGVHLMVGGLLFLGVACGFGRKVG